VDAVFGTAAEAWDDARSYLASPRGKELRRTVAGVLIVGAPLVSEIPVLRRTLVGRALRVAALGTLVVKGAEWLRDWEPAPAVDVGPGPARRSRGRSRPS
jgi:hypothetical protein